MTKTLLTFALATASIAFFPTYAGITHRLPHSPIASQRAHIAEKGLRTNEASNEYGRLVTIVSEDFSKFTDGTEEVPATDALATDWGGNFDESKVQTYGWGGKKVHEAGGTAYIEAGGSLFSPDVNIMDAVDYRCYVSFRGRLAGDATEGIPSVMLGYNSTKQCDPLTTQWQDYRVEFSGEYSGSYITIKASSAWQIDDVVIEKVMPFVSTPATAYFHGYTTDSFVAAWSAVKDAASYTLSVFSYNASNEIEYVLTDQPVQGTSHKVSGLKPIAGFYYFTVKAIDANGHPSAPTDPVCVEGLVVPTGVNAIDVTDNGFTAKWDAVAGSELYEMWVYRTFTAAAESSVDFLNTDFGFVSTADQDKIQDESIGYDAMPGWIICKPIFDDGAIGLDGVAAASSSYYASMESPSYDLTNNDGTIEISITAKVTNGTSVAISLFTAKDGHYSVYPESFERINDFTSEYQTRTFTLTGGGKESILYIEASDWGQVWITDFRISQKLKSGETATIPVYDTITDKTQIAVNDLTFEPDSKYYFTVRAIGVNHDETDYIWSDFVSSDYIATGAGIANATKGCGSAVLTGTTLTVTNPEGAAIAIYDMSGRTIYANTGGVGSVAVELPQKGVYLVRIGNDTVKIVR